MIIIEDKSELSNLLAEHGVLVVLFYAEWCSLGKSLYPLLSEIQSDYKEKVVFGKIDIDKNKLLKEHYNINVLPQIIIFKEGQKHVKLIGSQTREDIEEKINFILDE